MKPKRSELLALCGAEGLLCLIAFLIPLCALPVALILPVLTCLTLRDKLKYVSFAAILLPAVSALLHQASIFFSVSLLLPGTLTAVITLGIPYKKRFGLKGIFLYVNAYAISTAVCLLTFYLSYHTSPSDYLTDFLMESLDASKDRNQILYQLASRGLLAIPQEYYTNSLLFLFNQSGFYQQLFLETKLIVQNFASEAIPWLAVQFVLLGGIFVQLRVQRQEGTFLLVEKDERHPSEAPNVKVALPPGFRLLTIPKQILPFLGGLLLVALVLSAFGVGCSNMLLHLWLTLFLSIVEINGAAMLVFQLTSRNPERVTLAGALAAALYVLFPAVLFLLGLMDKLTHKRARSIGAKKDTHSL